MNTNNEQCIQQQVMNGIDLIEQQQQTIGTRSSGFRQIRFKDDKQSEDTLELAAVIVTIYDGSSYDTLFRSGKQHATDDSKVAVYACSKHDIKDLQNYLKHPPSKQKLKDRRDDLSKLLADLSAIDDPLCVAINYECCSTCANNGFHGASAEQMMKELQFFLRCGYVIMFSDFSLKALIKCWNEIGDKTELGTNPLIRTGEHSENITLKFNPADLKKCDCSQLQTVGDLCQDQNYCTVHCMGGTIRYSIKNTAMNVDTEPYEIKILTLAYFRKHANSVSIQVPDFDKEEKKKKKVGMKRIFGDAGHVILDYSNNTVKKNDEAKENDADEGKMDIDDDNGGLCGQILLSMTHWCELVKLGDSVNEDVLFDVAATNLGQESQAYKQMRQEYEKFGGKNASGQQAKAKKQWISQVANSMVQKQSPCNRRKKGSK